MRGVNGLLSLALMGTTVVACSSDGAGPDGNKVASVEVTPATATLNALGETLELVTVPRNSNGDILTSRSVSWSSSAGAVATVDPNGLVTAVGNGEATITATVEGHDGAAVVTVEQMPSQLAFTVQPAGIEAGFAFPSPITVELRDTRGNLVTSSTSAVTLILNGGPPGATLTGTTTVDAVGGVAAFQSVTVRRAGTGYRLGASSVTFASAESNTFDVAPSGAVTVEFSVDPPPSATGNTTIPAIEVAVLDEYGNHVPGGDVTIALEQAPWPRTTLSGTLTKPVADGTASFDNLRIDRPGDGYRLRVTYGSLAASSPEFAVATPFVQVSSGGWNATFEGLTCGATTAGVWCWGANSSGQLGSPAAAFQETVPFLVDGSDTFIEVSAGGVHACARTALGAVWCWGRGDEGQLGHGAFSGSASPVQVSGSGAGGLVFLAISAGYDHTCGVVSGQSVYCWGNNAAGKLGDGTATNRNTPTQVLGTGTAPYDLGVVSAGRTATCAISVARAAYCWGSGSGGALGTGNDNDQLTPALVSGSGVPPLLFGDISAGLGHACALVTGASAGDVYCWGSNLLGALGNGAAGVNSEVPVQVNGSIGFVSISAGSLVTCGVSIIQAVYCWGRNASGELGDGTLADSAVPVEVDPGGIPSWDRVTVGGVHVCGRASSGGWYCWGNNDDGRLGDGTTVSRSRPVRIVQ